MLAAILAALSFVPSLQAQKVLGGSDPDRKASTVYVFSDSFETLAGVCISFSQATWQDSYDGMLEVSGNYTRLGKNWWTSLDTVGALEIGGTKIEAGSYYLGLAVGKDGAFSLLVFDSKLAMQAGLLPSTTALYTGEAKVPTIKAPLTFAKSSLREAVARMEIELTADKDGATGKLSIRWGKHELTAPVKFHLAATKATAAPKK